MPCLLGMNLEASLLSPACLCFHSPFDVARFQGQGNKLIKVTSSFLQAHFLTKILQQVNKVSSWSLKQKLFFLFFFLTKETPRCTCFL